MRKKLVAFIKRWRMEWAVATVIAYVLAIPVTLYIFPDNNLWLALLILFTGLTGALSTLADMLVTAETHDEIE